MPVDERKGLRFPCECVSGLAGGYSDPWADVTKRKLLPNGTKEQIVTLLAEEPKTISQLAQALSLSAPSVHTHINDMLQSELLRESEEFEKRHPSERYYEPNFPVFKAGECAEFRTFPSFENREVWFVITLTRMSLLKFFRLAQQFALEHVVDVSMNTWRR